MGWARCGEARFGVAGHAGLRGQKAVAAVFAVVYTGDVLLNTALGLYEPTRWSTSEWVIDVVDKLVQAEATGLIFDRMQDVQAVPGERRRGQKGRNGSSAALANEVDDGPDGR